MAQRRMFNKSITNSGKFLKMPPTSRLLYYDLGMNADDDGYAEWFSTIRMTGSTEQDLQVLQANGFVKIFDENVLIILNWKDNNHIQKDRYTPSKYLNVYKMDTECIQNGHPGKVRLGKVRLGKESKEKRERIQVAFAPPSLQELKDYIQLNQYNVDPEQWLSFYESKGWLVGKTKMKDWKAAVRTWAIRNKDLPVTKKIDPIEQEAKELFAKLGDQAVFPFSKKYGDDALYTYKHCFPGAF